MRVSLLIEWWHRHKGLPLTGRLGRVWTSPAIRRGLEAYVDRRMSKEHTEYRSVLREQPGGNRDCGIGRRFIRDDGEGSGCLAYEWPARVGYLQASSTLGYVPSSDILCPQCLARVKPRPNLPPAEKYWPPVTEGRYR